MIKKIHQLNELNKESRLMLWINQINKSVSIKCRALQIDCDWTTKTAPKYFYFLQQIREKLDAHEDGGTFASLAMLSATIRLHQVKYPEKSGMPPVDKGVLMFYNMGESF